MGVFAGEWAPRERPDRLLSLGWFLSQKRVLDAHGALRFAREEPGEYRAQEIGDLGAAVKHTRWILALKAGRQWPLKRFFEQLDPFLAEGIALCVVPSADPFATDPPIRQLAQRLAAAHDRVDATGCLVRHTRIRNISLGGPSYRSLHRDTIRVEEPELLAGRDVLLLDDIVRSGSSLRACRSLLLAAGAASVQALALGRVAG